jgi:hypothetical protein
LYRYVLPGRRLSILKAETTLSDLGKTPWVDRTMSSVWDRIAKKVPKSWMPRLEEGSVKQQVTEYGCGHYGCVMPTNEPGLVCKLTTDVTEARFVAIAMPLGDVEGIVQYKKIFAIKEATHRGRPMFVLWRTEAFGVGGLSYSGQWQAPEIRNLIKDDHDKRTLNEGIGLLRQFQNEASVVRRFVNPRLQALSKGLPVSGVNRGDVIYDRALFLKKVWDVYENSSFDKVELESRWTGRPGEVFGAPKWMKGYPRVGVALSNCYAAAQEINNTAIVYAIGGALLNYIDDGLLLADVHTGNMGVSANNELIITDPGHVVEVNPRWATPVDVAEV